MNRSKLYMILHTKIRELLLYQEGKRYVLVLAKPEADFSLGCEQENQGSEIDAAYLSSGCGTVAVHGAGRPPIIHFIIYVLPANQHFLESRRADSNS